MARAGGSGGNSSRGFGGGGNRSFGGRSGGGGAPQRGGARPGGSVGGGGFGYGGGPRPGPGFGGPRYYGPGFGPAWGRGPGYGRRPFFSSGGCGCLVVPIALIIVLVLGAGLLFASPQAGQDSNSITKSTIRREPLPKGAVTETDYYTDNLGWIGNQTTLLVGMKNFYAKTGVQPYLYITDNIDGNYAPTDADAEVFANQLYDQLFKDEAHFLLIFYEYNGNYHTWYLSGNQAKTVMDTEAVDILLDYVDRYYYYSNLTDEEMFSKAFNDAGERIMTVETSPWIPVLIVVGVLAILVVIFIWWRQNKKQKNLEAQQNEAILQTPLDTFGSNQADDLAKKYDNNQNNNV